MQEPGTVLRQSAVETALEMNEAILSGLPLRRLMVIIARGAYAMVRSSLVVACTPAVDRPGLAVRSAIGHGYRSLRGWTIPLGLGALEALPEFAPVTLDAGRWADYLPAAATHQMARGLVVPLRAQGRTMGMLLFGNTRLKGPFSDEGRRLVQLFGAQAALAITYHETRQALVDAGLREDRERISRDLHDGIVQELYGLGMHLQATQQLPHAPALSRRLEGAVRDIDQVVADLRAYMRELQPTMLSNDQLTLGLHRLAADIADRTHLVVQVEVDEGLAARLSGHKQSLLLIAGERLGELSRRADVSNCRVRLREREGFVVLEVEDDGRGIHSEGDEFLHKIIERTPDLAGEIEVDTVSERGSVFRARILDVKEAWKT